jgi:outer membrane usher protein
MFLITSRKFDHGAILCARLPGTYTWLTPFFIAMASSTLCLAGENEQPPVEEFNTSFLQGASSSVDLQLLLSANSVLPGNYRVDLYSNETLVGRRDIDFRRNPKNGKVEACLTLDMRRFSR